MKVSGKALDRATLMALVESGDIDTVVMAFPDLFGRLVGKRATGRFFLEHVAEHGTENCDYLIACDIENNPVPGYRFASYDQGYGDMVARADWTAAWRVPWVDKTALVICDVFDVETGALINEAPRSILRAQVDAAASLGYRPMIGSEIEFFLFDTTYPEAHASGYRDLKPAGDWVQDYHVVQTTRDEPVIGAIRRGLEGAGVPIEFTKGEAGRGQHEINLDYTDALAMADRNVLYKTAAKEIAAQHGKSATFMAKYDFAETGSSCHVHSSLWSTDGSRALFHDEANHGASDLFRHYLAGLLATAREFSLLWAPAINSYKRFQPGSWAPTGVAWGVDNRTLGFRQVGHGSSLRIENRVPGADANSYLAFAGVLGGGLYGIRHEMPLGDAFAGNGYEANLPRIPSSIVEAIELWRGSTIAREVFGEDVHHHVLVMAEAEWRAFNNTVTDWERRRYFELI